MKVSTVLRSLSCSVTPRPAQTPFRPGVLCTHVPGSTPLRCRVWPRNHPEALQSATKDRLIIVQAWKCVIIPGPFPFHSFFRRLVYCSFISSMRWESVKQPEQVWDRIHRTSPRLEPGSSGAVIQQRSPLPCHSSFIFHVLCCFISHH